MGRFGLQLKEPVAARESISKEDAKHTAGMFLALTKFIKGNVSFMRQEKTDVLRCAGQRDVGWICRNI